MSETIAAQSHWRSLRDIDKVRLSGARLQAHHAIQWLARAARAYIPPQPDDGQHQFDLGWRYRGILDATIAQWRAVEFQDRRNLTLALINGKGPAGAQSIFLSGRTDAEVRHWLGATSWARLVSMQAASTRPRPIKFLPMPSRAMAPLMTR